MDVVMVAFVLCICYVFSGHGMTNAANYSNNGLVASTRSLLASSSVEFVFEETIALSAFWGFSPLMYQLMLGIDQETI